MKLSKPASNAERSSAGWHIEAGGRSNAGWPLAIILSGLFLLTDQWLKWQALHAWSAPRLLSRYFGWSPFLNPGVAFSLPVPGWLIITFTIPILLLILYILFKKSLPRLQSLGLYFIFGGALSNLIDRVLYAHTVDYVLIGTGVINLADTIIIGGFILYLFCAPRLDNK